MFFADKLISKQMQNHLVVKVVFTKNQSFLGETEIIGYNMRDEPREFALILNKNIDDDEKLKTLAHEFVHLKQYVYKELNEQMTLWHGKKVSEDDWDYHESPWEIEAETIGNKLFEEYNERFIK